MFSWFRNGSPYFQHEILTVVWTRLIVRASSRVGREFFFSLCNIFCHLRFATFVVEGILGCICITLNGQGTEMVAALI